MIYAIQIYGSLKEMKIWIMISHVRVRVVKHTCCLIEAVNQRQQQQTLLPM